MSKSNTPSILEPVIGLAEKAVTFVVSLPFKAIRAISSKVQNKITNLILPSGSGR